MKVMGGYVFACVDMYIHRYIFMCHVCEQLPGANSSPIVTILCQSYPWPQGTRWLNFWRSMWKVKVGRKVCALLSLSSFRLFSAGHVCIYELSVRYVSCAYWRLAQRGVISIFENSISFMDRVQVGRCDDVGHRSQSQTLDDASWDFGCCWD